MIRHGDIVKFATPLKELDDDVLARGGRYVVRHNSRRGWRVVLEWRDKVDGTCLVQLDRGSVAKFATLKVIGNVKYGKN